MTGTTFKTSNATTYSEAGYMQLIKTLQDYSDSKNPEDIYTSGRNVAGIITPTYTLNTTTIESENSAFPAATRVTGATQEIVINFNSYDELLSAFATNSKIKYVDNAPLEFVNQARAVEKDGANFVIKMGAPLHQSTTLLVRDEYANISLTEVTTTPEENEFKVDYATGVITVNTIHEGKAFFVTGAYVAPKQKQIITPSIPVLSTYKAIFYGKKSDFKNTSDEKWEATIIDQVQFTGTISQPPKQKAPGTWSITLSMQEPRAGRDAMITKTTNPLFITGFKTLTVASIAGATTGKTKITVVEPLSSGASYVYKTASVVAIPEYNEDLTTWTTWDGTTDITATTGNQIVIAEIDVTKKALGAGLATVTSKI